jgi:AcrR family transcriptional regulator
MVAVTETAPVRRGPKRSEQSKAAILTAAFELSGEVGYAALTIEGIAKRAGVGKQTIYRWWDSKADVLLDALVLKADLFVSVADRGGFEVEVRRFLEDSFALARRTPVADILRALMAEAQIDPEFGERFRTSFLQQRRGALSTILDRASARAELPADVSVPLILDIVFGVIWYRLLATREPFDPALVEQLVAVLLPGGHTALLKETHG